MLIASPISKKNIHNSNGESYFPSIASSIVYDWPIWWGGGNLTRSSVWKLVKSLNLCSLLASHKILICCALSSVHMIVLVTLGSDALDRSH